ncbi:MAG: helix-turn-helix domain-containing protein [Pedobacter sp.]|nr:MAG: helix-turn-helix domain-containing protein [Pedobacter sp.]
MMCDRHLMQEDVNGISINFSELPAKTAHTERSFIEIADMRYHPDQLYLIMPDNREVSLTVREAEVLEHLARNINSLVKKKDILFALWGNDDYFNGKSLEVFISRLRRLFKSSNEVSIENVYGMGYILRVR